MQFLTATTSAMIVNRDMVEEDGEHKKSVGTNAKDSQNAQYVLLEHIGRQTKIWKDKSVHNATVVQKVNIRRQKGKQVVQNVLLGIPLL